MTHKPKPGTVPVGVVSDIQAQVEVETVPSSKNQLQNVLHALGMDDDINMDDEVDDCYSDGD